MFKIKNVLLVSSLLVGLNVQGIELSTLSTDSSFAPVDSSAGALNISAGSLDNVYGSSAGVSISLSGDISGAGESLSDVGISGIETSSDASAPLVASVSSVNPSGILSSSIPNSSSASIGIAGLLGSIGTGLGTLFELVVGSGNSSSYNSLGIDESVINNSSGFANSATSVPNFVNTSSQNSSLTSLGSLTGSAGFLDGTSLGGPISYVLGKLSNQAPVVPAPANCPDGNCNKHENIVQVKTRIIPVGGDILPYNNTPFF